MTRIYFDRDEWYPVMLPRLEPSSWPDTFTEVEPEFVTRYNAALAEWRDVQLELAKRFFPDDKAYWWPMGVPLMEKQSQESE